MKDSDRITVIPFHENLDTIRSRTASPAPSAQELLA